MTSSDNSNKSISQRRVNFYDMKQRSEEPPMAFLMRIKSAAADCSFASPTIVDEMIKNKLIHGLLPCELKTQLTQQDHRESLVFFTRFVREHDRSDRSDAMNTTSMDVVEDNDASIVEYPGAEESTDVFTWTGPAIRGNASVRTSNLQSLVEQRDYINSTVGQFGSGSAADKIIRKRKRSSCHEGLGKEVRPEFAPKKLWKPIDDEEMRSLVKFTVRHIDDLTDILSRGLPEEWRCRPTNLLRITVLYIRRSMDRSSLEKLGCTEAEINIVQRWRQSNLPTC